MKLPWAALLMKRLNGVKGRAMNENASKKFEKEYE
jgi:hypothetical protein